MSSLDLREHSSLETLTRAYVKEKSPELARGSSKALVFAEPLIAGAALVAQWILECAPMLLKRPSLRIAVVSSVPRRPELAAGERTYQLLPSLLGNPHQAIAVSVVTQDPDKGGHVSTDNFFRTYCLPIHAYLENAPDGFVDLIVFHDVDIAFSDSLDWTEPLARAIASGTKVLAVAAQEDEQLLMEGLLGIQGFTVTGTPVRNRFAPKFPWGRLMWEVGAGDRPMDRAAPAAVVEEVSQLLAFTKRYVELHQQFPPLQQYGVRVTGKESPVKDGSPMLRLPEGLYFDPATERFSGLTPDGPVSIHELDELGRSSALLASYDGRTDRFHQVMWAVRVFFECGRVLPPLTQAYFNDESEDGEEAPQVCPSCGGVHTATERVDTMKEYLSAVFQGESPRTQVRAALELALDIVKRGGGVPEARPAFDDDDDEYDDAHEDSELRTYEYLLNRGYFLAAWVLVQESDDFGLVDEGVDEEGWSLPMLLVEYSKWDILESFINDGGDVSVGSNDGGTVFHALSCGDESVPPELFRQLCDALTESGIDADTPDEAGISPLEAAVMNDAWHAVAQLIDAGANVALTDLDVKALAAGLSENGFDTQAKKLTPKPRQKRTRNPGQLPAPE